MLPIKHPEFIITSSLADDYTFKNHYNPSLRLELSIKSMKNYNFLIAGTIRNCERTLFKTIKCLDNVFRSQKI